MELRIAMWFILHKNNTTQSLTIPQIESFLVSYKIIYFIIIWLLFRNIYNIKIFIVVKKQVILTSRYKQTFWDGSMPTPLWCRYDFDEDSLAWMIRKLIWLSRYIHGCIRMYSCLQYERFVEYLVSFRFVHSRIINTE